MEENCWKSSLHPQTSVLYYRPGPTAPPCTKLLLASAYQVKVCSSYAKAKNKCRARQVSFPYNNKSGWSACTVHRRDTSNFTWNFTIPLWKKYGSSSHFKGFHPPLLLFLPIFIWLLFQGWTRMPGNSLNLLFWENKIPSPPSKRTDALCWLQTLRTILLKQLLNNLYFLELSWVYVHFCFDIYSTVVFPYFPMPSWFSLKISR